MSRVTFLFSLACLILLGARPALADRTMVEADLAVCTSLNVLGGQLQQAGAIMEKWVSGRTPSDQVQQELKAILRAFQLEEARLAKIPLTTGAQPLLQGALRCAGQRRHSDQ